MTTFSLVAHRGYPLRYPDNSLSGVRAALDAGASYLEVDVQTSTDGTPYLFHDDDLRRVAGCKGRLTELSDAEIGELRASETARLGEAFADEPIARLDQLAEELMRRPGVFTFVEIKPVAIERFGARPVVTSVLEALRGLEDRVAIISFSNEALFETRAQDPGEGDRERQLPIAPILTSWKQLASEETARLAPEYVFSNTRHLPRSGPIELPGLPETRLVVYEVTDPQLAAELGQRGAEFVETFHYPEMRAALEGTAS